MAAFSILESLLRTAYFLNPAKVLARNFHLFIGIPVSGYLSSGVQISLSGFPSCSQGETLPRQAQGVYIMLLKSLPRATCLFNYYIVRWEYECALVFQSLPRVTALFDLSWRVRNLLFNPVPIPMSGSLLVDHALDEEQQDKKW